MKQNKGIVGLGLIAAIVLGVVIVGGGAYYVGKNKGENKEVKTPENVLPNNNGENNLPDEDKNGLPDFATLPHEYGDENPKTSQVSTGCTSSSAPSIKILSPNGGETYTAGQKIMVKWESCNVTSPMINFSLMEHDLSLPYKPNVMNIKDKAWISLNSFDSYTGTPNDGIEQLTLPKNSDPSFNPGQNYFINVYGENKNSQGVRIFDYSDNLFTINSAISTANWKTYTDSDYGFSFQYPDTWSLYYGPDNIVNRNGEITAREVNFINTVDKNATEGSGSTFRTTLSVKYNLPPNGAESYNYAVTEFNAKNGWYKTGSKEIQVLGNKAIEAYTTMTVDGKGHKIDPALRLIIVDFLDKQKTGSIQLQFKTPLPNEGIEVPNFEKLLTTFKFTK